MQIDIDTVVYAVIAIFILARLWSVLGTRNEDEPQRPNPFVRPAPKPTNTDAAFDPSQPPAATSPFLQAAIVPPASLAGGLAQVKTMIADFDEKAFLQDARTIFTTTVEAYAAAKLDAAAGLLSPALLLHLQQAANARLATGQTAQTRILRIKDAEVIAARAEGATATITVKFVSDQENILRDASGTVIGGAEGKAEEITDIWVFTREATPDAKWVAAETRG